MISQKTPSQLSPASHDFYRRVCRENRVSHMVETTDAISVAAITEIANAGLGTATISDRYATLYVTRIAKGFSVARRNDPDPHLLYVEIEVLPQANSSEGFLLAALYGATIENRTNSSSPWPTWNITVRHDKARDSDHSLSILATFDIDHPTITNIDGHSTTLVGALTSARIWPTNLDVTRLDTHSSTRIPEPDMCTYDQCAKDPHPRAPYLPVERDDLVVHLRRPVRITTSPISLVDANGMNIHTPVLARN